MGTTTNYAIPYPEPTDFVTDGATAMENIAETVDAQMFATVANRNLLYNGAMQVAQRGTSTTSITLSNYYTADRWRHGVDTMGTWTSTIENDAPTGSGFRKSLKMLCTTADASPAAGDVLQIQQLLEGQDLQAIRKGTSSAQSITMSFWVKSNRTGTYIAELYDNDNTRQCSKSYVINATGVWEYKTVTFPADTIGAFDNDNALSLYVIWWLGAGSTFSSGTLNTTWASVTNANRAVGQINVASAINNYWQITGVQMTLGTVAPPFEFKDFQTDLRECQRYYEKSYDTTTTPGTLTEVGVHWHSGSGNGSGRHYVPIRFKVEKRSNGYTVTTYDPSAVNNTWRTNNTFQTGLQRTPTVEQKGTSGFTMNVEDGGYSWIVGNTRGHWSASDEL